MCPHKDRRRGLFHGRDDDARRHDASEPWAYRRPLEASALTSGAYLAMILAAILRPFAELIPQHYHLILGASGLLWVVAFGAFIVEYAPILCTRSLGRSGR